MTHSLIWRGLPDDVAIHFKDCDWSEYFRVEPWSRRSVCRHEAGHLVAYHEQIKRPIYRVSVYRSKRDPQKFEGEVRYHEESKLPPTIEAQVTMVEARKADGMPPLPPKRGDTFGMQLIALDLRMAGIRSFSGVAAEYPVAGGYEWTSEMSEGTRVDRAGFLHAVMKRKGWARDIDPCWSSLRLARELVDRNWGAVMAIEAALFEAGELDGETVLRLIERAPKVRNPFREGLLPDETRKPVGWVVWRIREAIFAKAEARARAQQ